LHAGQQKDTFVTSINILATLENKLEILFCDFAICSLFS
jgi:hypothetical protein